MVKKKELTTTQLRKEMLKIVNNQKLDFDKKLLRLQILQEQIYQKHFDKFQSMLTKFKSEFFNKVDPILKEIGTDREARTLLENRLEEIEEIHPNNQHLFATV